jgi:hypothetical protein
MGISSNRHRTANIQDEKREILLRKNVSLRDFRATDLD